MAYEDDPAAGGWHLDKRVPVAILGALLVQTFAVGWFVAQLSADVEENRHRIERLEVRQDVVRQAIPRIEQILQDIRRRMNGGGDP